MKREKQGYQRAAISTPIYASRVRLSAAIAAAFAAVCVAPMCHAAPAVTNCSASGIGSLAAAVAAATSGDTIDMTALACGTITLGGDLLIVVPQLTIAGPRRNKLTIIGSDGTIYDQKSGTLTLQDLTITSNGLPVRFGHGGCVQADDLNLTRVAVKNCHMDNDGTRGITAGGAVSASGNLTMIDSQVTGSSVTASAARGGGVYVGGDATISGSVIAGNAVMSRSSGGVQTGGGGLYVAGSLTMTRSIVSGNAATSADSFVVGGGIWAGTKPGRTNYAYLGYSTVTGNVLHSSTQGSVAQVQGGGMYSQKFMGMRYSTVDHNQSNGVGGGIANGPNAKLNLQQTTISGNIAAFQGGAIYTAYDKSMSVLNSTIGLNYTQSVGQCAGIFFGNGGTLSMVSTIVAGNRKYQSTLSPCDLGAGTGKSITITSASSNNLIQQASGNTVPTDTLTSDPQFFTLAANGGPTRTLGIRQTSPARQTGYNIFGFTWEQRGAGYRRTLSGKTDIGAFEWEGPGDGDTIFANGFEPDR